jgi:hypothetical protein
MRVAVVGSRTFGSTNAKPGYLSDEDTRARRAVYNYIREKLSNEPFMIRRPMPTIISGGAGGVDTWARNAAKRFDTPFEEYPADWEHNGKAAGYIRNQEMVLAADKVIAFWDGQSKGTKHTIDLCLKHRTNLEVIFP